jgi:hypothetical protein
VRRLLEILTLPLRAILAAPTRIRAPLRRILVLSVPARVAIVVAIVLPICAVIAFVLLPENVMREQWTRPGHLTLIVVLLIAIPLVVYTLLNLWLEGEASPYPDIDRAWKAGMAALAEQGLDLLQVPLFLILGAADENQAKSLLGASRLNLNVREIPQGPAAIHWFANREGIYLVCTDTCCLGRLAKLGQELALGKRHAPAAPARGFVGQTIRRTIDALRNVIGASASRENLVPAQTPQPRAAAAGGAATAASAPAGGTMMIDDLTAKAYGMAPRETPAQAEPSCVTLSEREVLVQERRLGHLCRLIRRARQPLTPVNGILTLLPFLLIERSDDDAAEVQQAVARDLTVLSPGLMVRCPVTAMVVGLDEDGGFRELARRVPREMAERNRFGKGFAIDRKGSDVWAWNLPTAERLETLAAHACGTFEDWVYTLFSGKDALSKPGNVLLFALLCKIRSRVQHRLTKILASSYAIPKEQSPSSEGFLFSGCYFAATGESEDRQAFVKGVFDKLPEEQNALEWTETAYREDRRYQLLAQWGMVLDTGLLLGLIGMVVSKWFHFW